MTPNRDIKLFVLILGVIPSVLCAVFTVIIGAHILKFIGTILGIYLVCFVTVLWCIHVKSIGSKALTILISAWLSFISVIFIFMSIEVFYSIKCRDISVGPYESPSGCIFYPKYYHRNKFGYRDKEFELQHPLNVYRIFVLGDSFTRGTGLKDYTKSYPKVLENILNNQGSAIKYEVINAGVGGTNTADQLEELKNSGIAFNPDAVILGYFINDTEMGEENIPIFKNRNRLLEAVDKVMCAHFFSWYLFRLKVRDILLPPNSFMATITSEKHFANHEQVFKEMVDYLKERNIDFIVVILSPVTEEKHTDGMQAYDMLTEKAIFHIRYLCEKYNVKYVDMYKITQAMIKKHGNLKVSPYDSHPNEILHQAYAEEIVSSKLLERAK